MDDSRVTWEDVTEFRKGNQAASIMLENIALERENAALRLEKEALIKENEAMNKVIPSGSETKDELVARMNSSNQT